MIAARAEQRLLILVAAVALLVRLGAALGTDGLRTPEVAEYDAIARNLLAGRGFTYSHIGVVYYSYAAPLQSWITAAGYWLTGSIVPLMLVQVSAGALLAAVTAAIARRLFGGWIAAATAGVLVALHPGLVVYSATKAHPLTFDALFFALAALQSLRLAERLTMARSAQLGVIVGLGAMSRATIIIFLPIIALWLLLRAPRASRRTAVGCAVVAGLCAAAIIAPWSVRNSLLHGRFVFMVTTDSEVFWRGNNPHATGHSYIDAGRPVLYALSAGEMRDLQQQPHELAQAQWFATRAREFIQANPDTFVRLTLLKFYSFWWFAPQTGTLYPRHWRQLYMAYYIGAIVLALFGARELLRAGRSAVARFVLVSAFLLGVSALQSLYYVEGRHRWAIEPIMLALSGGGLGMLLNRNRLVVPVTAAPTLPT